MGGNFVWPKVSEVANYRKQVRQVVLNVIDKTPLKLPVTQESQWVRDEVHLFNQQLQGKAYTETKKNNNKTSLIS